MSDTRVVGLTTSAVEEGTAESVVTANALEGDFGLEDVNGQSKLVCLVCM